MDENIERVYNIVNDYLKDACLYPCDGVSKKRYDEAYKNLKRLLPAEDFEIAKKILYDYFGNYGV